MSRKPRKRKDVRQSYEALGVSKERLRELKSLCRSGAVDAGTLRDACAGFSFIEPWIVLSVTKQKTYDVIEWVEGLGRIPCGRTDFYGYRRQFYGNLDKELRKGAEGEAT